MDSNNNPNTYDNIEKTESEPSAEQTTAPSVEQTPAPITEQAPEPSPEPKLKPNIIQRFKTAFSKTNPHYKRNRAILAISSGSLGIIVAICLIAFSLVPALNGNLVISSVTPTIINDGILDAKSHFIVNTEYGSIEKVRNALYLEPAIDYDIKELTPGTAYEIVPASPLADNTIFNVDSVSNEVVAYKWAFQTKKDLSVSKIYPANGANFVSENSVIEFSFSYPNIENVADHFSISPQVPGTLTKLDRSWRFTPDSPLAKDTTYEITISAGVTYGEEVMTQDFHSSFSTFAHSVASSDAKSEGITLDGVSYFIESETPIVVFGGNALESFDNSEYISIEKIQNADDYVKYLKGEQVSGEIIGNYDFEKTLVAEHSSDKAAILKQTLPTGYYIFHFKSADNQNLYTSNIEVNNLAAYAFESERDIVVWVAEGGELKPGIKVNYRDQEYETDASGLLKIENSSDYSDNIEYLKIGDPNQPLVIATKDFKNNLYPQGFIYTDRPLYTPNDTIKFWGYIPLPFFKDSPNRDSFSVVFDEIKQNVTIDSEGFFSGEIKLDNHKDTDGNISLVYNDTNIATRYISVENYTLENYTYEFISDKNYINAGENIEFSVKVSHITGFPAVNKDLVVSFDGHDYYASTDSTGKASFSFPTEQRTATWDNYFSLQTEWVDVKSGGAEYNKYSTDKEFFIFSNNMYIRGDKVSGSDQIEFSVQSLNLSEQVNTNYSYENLTKSNYSGPATLRLYETRYHRYISKYGYNEYTKENVPIYNIGRTSSVIQEVAVNITDGKLIYDYPTDFKNPEEDVRYSYSAALYVPDSTGRPAYSNKVNYYSNSFLGESTNSYGRNAIESWLYNPTNNWRYTLYRFGLRDTVGTGPYSFNDTLKLGLCDYSDASVENTGQVLAITFKESIINTNIFSDNTMDIAFDKNLYPGAEIIGAYFKDGKFYRIAPRYLDYDETDSELTISIETDKTSYAPGDTVKAKVIVSRPDGSRANGKINLSVVNEAIFNAAQDNTSILSSIYANKSFKSYSMSTFLDYELYAGGGMGAAGGGRSDFGDTIFFGDQNLSNGEAEFEFKLNDSITAFRLTALAVENSDIINAGVNTAKIVSSLPLSISTVMPKKVKNTDDLVLNATSITSAGDTIDYTFTIEELDKTITTSAAPGQSVTANFGKLDLGSYTAVISAKDSAGNEDKMTYPIEIVETAQEVAIRNTIEIEQETELHPTRNPIIVEFYDKDTKDYISFLDYLEDNQTVRLDTLVGYYKSLEYKNKYYGEEASVRTPNYDAYLTTDGMLKPLENAEGDLILTALSNYYTPDYFELSPKSYSINLDDDASTVVEKLLVLASFKEPILLDLQNVMASRSSLTEDEEAMLGIAFAFVGDYDSAASIYQNLDHQSVRGDILAILSSFISKEVTASEINSLIATEPSADYLPFAVLSFFENNEVDLSQKSAINATVNSETNRVDITPLEIVKKTYLSKDLASLKFSPVSGEVFAQYYYQGGISELGESYTTDIVAQLENISVGQTGALVLDISGLSNRNGTLNIALPASLKFSASFSGQDGLYLSRNNNEYIRLSVSDRYQGNTIRIPLYVATPGNYKLEPVIFMGEDGNHISDSIVFDAQ